MDSPPDPSLSSKKEDVVLLVYWLMRSESTLISENLTTTME